MSDKPTDRGPRPDGRELLERYVQERPSGLIREYWSFLLHGKKWYLMPIVAVLMALGALIVVGGTGAAPFLYTLF